MAFFNMTWAGNAGSCWELWKCSPCCGEPCNFMEGLYCCCSWKFCGPCNLGKLYAKTLNQECHIVNHCLPAWILSICVATIVRHNVRLAAEVGTDDLMSWVGDCCCLYFCSLCAMAQLLRAVKKEDWDSVAEMPANISRIYVSPLKMVKA